MQLIEAQNPAPQPVTLDKELDDSVPSTQVQVTTNCNFIN